MSCVDYVVCTVRMEAAEAKLRSAVDEFVRNVKRLHEEAEKTLKRTAAMAEKAAKIREIVAPSQNDGSQQTADEDEAAVRDPKERKTD
jgi:enoyl-CoA hydratase/carnithine racemase